MAADTRIEDDIQASPHGSHPVEAGVNAQDIQAHSSSFKQLTANTVDLKDSAVLMAQTGELNTTESAVGFAYSNQAVLQNTQAGVVVSNEIQLIDSDVRILIGRQVRADHIKTGIFIGRSVDATVETQLDGRKVALAGLAAGFGLGIVLTLGKLIFGEQRNNR
jgi:hypothetical protein